METIRHGLHDVGVDGVDPVSLVVDQVLPPDVGGEGSTVGSPEGARLDVVSLKVPGWVAGGQY